MRELRATVLERRALDFEGLARSTEFGAYFQDPEYITGLVKELKQERSSATTAFAIALAAGLVALSGGLPKNATVALFGMSLPLSFLTQQLVALAAAIASTRAMFAMLNASLMGRMLAKLGDVMDQPDPEYFAAKHDADALWQVLIRRKTEGFVSPAGERIGLTSLRILMSIAVVVHATLVTGGTVAALVTAIRHNSMLGTALSALSVTLVVMGFLGGAFCVLVPIRYRWVEPDTHAQKEAA